MMRASASVLVLTVAAACARAVVQESPPPAQPEVSAPRTPVFTGRAFVFRADLEAGRALGWLDPGVSDEGALESVRAALLSRLRGSGRFAEATVALEPGARLAVTFVGDQPAEVESYLTLGLALPGRLEARAEPDADDLERLGTTLAVERERLEAWRRAGGGKRALEDLRRPASTGGDAGAGGGASAGLEWMGDPSVEGGARLVLAEPVWRFERGSLEGSALRPDPSAEPPLGLDLELLAEPLGQLARWADERGERALFVALDGRVLAPLASPPRSTLSLGRGHTPTGVRALALALGGEPLPAPLVLEERTTRPLEGVRAR